MQTACARAGEVLAGAPLDNSNVNVRKTPANANSPASISPVGCRDTQVHSTRAAPHPAADKYGYPGE